MKHYLVTGRICFDDEDTQLCFEAESKADAYKIYEDLMWEQHGASSETREALEANGEGVFVNGIFVSDTPITEATE